MAVPAILGIPALISFIGSGIVSIVSFFVKKYTFKGVVFTAAIVAILGAMSLLYSQFSGFISELALSMPSEMQMAAMFLPSNTNVCLGVIFSAEIAAAVYRLVVYVSTVKMDFAS